MNYDVNKAIAYAKEWAYSRNPRYYNFDSIGGDCTNFVSQCLYAGGGRMNFTPDTGWYYKSATNRAAAWSGVEYLYNFLTTNLGPGPYAAKLPLEFTKPGDIIQLSFDGEIYKHSLFVVAVSSPDENGIKIAAHTFDTYNKNLSNYYYSVCRLLHIEGFR